MTAKRKETVPSLLHKGQEITIDIDNIGSDGQGIGRYEGMAVFVPETLPGEQGKARVTLVKKSFAVAAPLSIDKASPDRVQPVCPVYELCGGCQLQHLSYEGELRMKTQQVEDALTRIGHLNGVKVMPTLRNDHPDHYRNKMQIPVAGSKGKLHIGCFAKGTHRVIDVENCYIQKERNNDIAAVVRKWMETYRIPAHGHRAAYHGTGWRPYGRNHGLPRDGAGQRAPHEGPGEDAKGGHSGPQERRAER